MLEKVGVRYCCVDIFYSDDLMSLSALLVLPNHE